MDPTASLAAFNEAMSRARDAHEFENDDEELNALREATEAAENLHEWLSNGGFPPDTWAGAGVNHILLVGDPLDGIDFYTVEGPDDPAIERRFANETWWVTEAPVLTVHESGGKR